MLLFQHNKKLINLHEIHEVSVRNDGATIGITFTSGETIPVSYVEWENMSIMLEGDGIVVPSLNHSIRSGSHVPLPDTSVKPLKPVSVSEGATPAPKAK